MYMIQKLHTPFLDEVMKGITFLGESGWFWILVAVLLFCQKRTRKIGLAVGLLLGNIILKPLIARQRPCWLDGSIPLLIASPRDFSFPSGHTLASFEGAVSIFLYRRDWGLWALALAVLIAFSRLYLFVHFPTDVLAGAVLGTAIALGVHRLLKWTEKRRKNQEEVRT